MHNSIVILSSEKIVSYEVIISLGKLCTGAEKFLREIMQLPTRNSEEPTFILGMLWSFLMVKTGDIRLVIIMHALSNLFGSVIAQTLMGVSMIAAV